MVGCLINRPNILQRRYLGGGGGGGGGEIIFNSALCECLILYKLSWVNWLFTNGLTFPMLQLIQVRLNILCWVYYRKFMVCMVHRLQC